MPATGRGYSRRCRNVSDLHPLRGPIGKQNRDVPTATYHSDGTAFAGADKLLSLVETPRLVTANQRAVRHGVRLTAAVLGVAALAALAAAQEPPLIHGFVEPCTVGFVQDANSDCEACSSVDGSWPPCATRLGSRGYTLRCRTSQHSAPAEVWCLPRPPAPSNAPPSPAVLTLAAIAVLGGFAGFLKWRARPRKSTSG